MPRRSNQSDPKELLESLRGLLRDFDVRLGQDDLRAQVISLVPAFNALRDLGSSLVQDDIPGARERILFYLKKYPKTRIDGSELMVVAGISEWARRVRELRVEFGWKIYTGYSIAEIIEAEETNEDWGDLDSMGPDEYFLADEKQDRDAAHRWNLANSIRKGSGGMQSKLIEFLQANVGKPVSGEELRYVAGNKTEWARRVRELRTEQGWPIVTRQDGRADLNVGDYLLEKDRQAPQHDRKIKDEVRKAVLVRDKFRCRNCGWARRDSLPEDFRVLELHHVEEHAKGGDNSVENLITLCDTCHDALHAGRVTIEEILAKPPKD